jgi:hypothetical protein
VKSERAALAVAYLVLALRCYRFKIERVAAIEFVKEEKHGLTRIKSWQTSNTKTGTMSRTARCRSGVSCGEHKNTS